jgi:DNA-binding response OmpR family regulator
MRAMPGEKDGDPIPGEDDSPESVDLGIVPSPSVTPGDDAPVVLVVEDDAEIRGMVVRALGVTHTVYEATDGQEAREILDTIPVPDAIVCDVMMPRLDGLALAKLLRKDPVLKRIPILFLTARTGALDVVAGINVGARHYVTKPFKVADLVAKVKSMTSRTR